MSSFWEIWGSIYLYTYACMFVAFMLERLTVIYLFVVVVNNIVVDMMWIGWLLLKRIFVSRIKHSPLINSNVCVCVFVCILLCCWILCCDLIHFLKVVITVYRYRCLYLNKTRRRWIFVLVAGCLLHLVCGIYFHHFVINYPFSTFYMTFEMFNIVYIWFLCHFPSKTKPKYWNFYFQFFVLFIAGTELATI